MPSSSSAQGADQLGRIEHNHVVLPPLGEHLPHVRENVGLDETDADLVEVGVFAGQAERLLVEIDAGGLGRLAQPHRLHGEAARVAAEVQHGPPAAELGQPAAVFALVAEESRLVPPGKSHAEPRAILAHGDLLGQLVRGHLRRLLPLLAEELRTGAHQRVPGAAQRGQPVQNRPGPLIHAQRVDLRRERIGEAIDHQPRQAVRLGVDQPIGVADLVQPQQVAAEPDRLLQPFLPAGIIRQLGPLEQHADGQLAAGIIQAVAEQLLAGAVDRHQVAGPGAFHLVDPLAIDGRVSRPEADADGRDRHAQIGASGRCRSARVPRASCPCCGPARARRPHSAELAGWCGQRGFIAAGSAGTASPPSSVRRRGRGAGRQCGRLLASHSNMDAAKRNSKRHREDVADNQAGQGQTVALQTRIAADFSPGGDGRK